MDATAIDSGLGRAFWRKPEAAAAALAPLTGDVADADFRRLADNIPTLCWIAGGDGYIVWYNRRWHDYCGTTPAEMEGWGWQSVHDPERLPQVLERWTAAIASGAPFEMTFPLCGADGVYRPFLTRVQPLADASGAVVRWFGVNTEISAQAAAEDALRDERDRGRGVLDGIDEGLVVLDFDFKIIGVNGIALAMNDGIAREAAIGRSHWHFWPGTHDTVQGELFRRVMATRAAEAIEVHYTWTNGYAAWLDVRVFPHPEGIAIFFRDQTERRAADDRLRLSEARAAAVADAIDVMVWSTLPDGYHDYYNQRWYDFTGMPEGSTDGEAWNGLFHADDQARAWETWRHSLATGDPYRIEYRLRHRGGGYRWMTGRATCVRDAAGAIVRWYGTCTDIDDSVAAREILARSREELEARVAERTAELEASQAALAQAQKMEAIGQLTGGIAHDFNNMLSIVIGSLDLARRRIGDEPRVVRLLDNAAEGARRAAELTARLLAFSRQQPLQPAVIDVNRLAGTMSELMLRSIGETVRIETVLAGGLWRVRADAAQLESALLNLCVNARDAMPGGGRLTIETCNASLDDAYARAHPGIAAGQYVQIAVTDTGSGMPADVAARAFEPFYTTKTVGKGTGLGLSQVYGYVKQSGGHVKIYSEPGTGTTIKIYLPRSLDPLAEPAVAPGEIPDALPHECILLVEDDPSVRSLSADALRELGYAVVEAASGAEALVLLDTHPAITLMLTDIVMPDMNGRVLADRAAERRPDLPVLFTSGYTRNAIVHDGTVDAGVAFLAKPFSVEQLAVKVRLVLDAAALQTARNPE